MNDDILREIMKSYSANISETIDLAVKKKTYKIAKVQLSRGLSENFVAETLELSPAEMQSIKKELGLTDDLA